MTQWPGGKSQALPPSNPRKWEDLDICGNMGVSKGYPKKIETEKKKTSISGSWSCSNYQTCYFKWGIPDFPYSTHVMQDHAPMEPWKKYTDPSPWTCWEKENLWKEVFYMLWWSSIIRVSRYPIDHIYPPFSSMRIFQRKTTPSDFWGLREDISHEKCSIYKSI